MLRTFEQHAIRSAESLGGRWEFVIEPERRDRSRLPRGYSRGIYVPSAWEQIPGLANYRGRGWLRTSVLTVDERALRLVFGGVSHTGTVYVDGQQVGQHQDAFTPWDVVVPGLEPGEHEVVVEVDNTFGDHSALHIDNDYYTYGGITRPVELQYVPEVFIDRLFATPVRAGSRWRLDVRVRLRNWSEYTLERTVAVALGEDCHEIATVTMEPGATREVSGTLRPRDVVPWEPDSPCLYEAVVLLLDGDNAVDDLVDRIGFRDARVRGRRVLLNGRPVRLRGVNRHEDHPQFGNALPLEAMVADLETLADLGCNFVRTCHYPNDLRFLDLCDEMGFLVWEESHARSTPFGHPRFREQIAQSTTEMIEWHWNRPCIVLWGCLNECESHTPEGRTEYERVIGLIKELDRSRPVTFASDKAERDLCLDLVDVVSWNRYDAWYAGGVADVAPALRRALRWLHSDASGGKGKPVILSEFGAGAIYGERSPRRQKWSEEYQADVLDESLRVYLNHRDVSGVAIWQFADCRVCPGHWRGRPRTMNNKGIVDEYRRPKLAYEVVKARMHEAMRGEGT